jgi:hypothetical protein
MAVSEELVGLQEQVSRVEQQLLLVLVVQQVQVLQHMEEGWLVVSQVLHK